MEHTAAAEYYNAYVHSNLMHYNALKLIVVLNSCPKISQVIAQLVGAWVYGDDVLGRISTVGSNPSSAKVDVLGTCMDGFEFISFGRWKIWKRTKKK